MNISIFVFVVLINTIASASNILSVEVENYSTINVTLSNTSKGERLSLKDYSGTTLYDITLDGDLSYSKFFDFSEVEDGIYFVETETEFDVKITPVIKNSLGLSLIENSTVTVFKPNVSVHGGTVDILISKLDDSPVEVSIHDALGSVIYDEELGEETSVIKRTYNVESFPHGYYDIRFSVNDRVFVKEIKL